MNPGAITFLKAVLEASWQGSLVILLVLLIRPLLGLRVPARWKYMLWTFVLIRLLVPAFVLPRSPASLQNIPAVKRPIERAQVSLDNAYTDYLTTDETRRPAPQRIEFAGQGESSTPLSSLPAPRSRKMPWWEIGAFTWFCGAALFAAWIIGATFRLHRRLRRESGMVDKAIVSVWKSCCARFSMTHPPRLIATRTVDSPALVGVLRPALLIPAQAQEIFSAEDWEHIFMHELAHFRRRDHWTQVLQLLALCAHWFNPLVWIGFRFLRADRELAADELALKRLSGDRAAAYGDTLLKVLSGRSAVSFQPGMVGVVESGSQLKQRLRSIIAFGPRQAVGSAVGVGLVIVLAAVVLGRQEEQADISAYAGMKPSQMLVMAAGRGDLPVVRKVLDDGADINSVVSVLLWEKKTPLSAAAAHNQMDVVRFLLSKGAQLNPAKDGTHSAVSFALQNGWLDCADYLIAKGAVADPPALAAAKGDRAAIDKMLAAGQPDLAQLKLLCEIAAVNGHKEIFSDLSDAIDALGGEVNWDNSVAVNVIAHNQRDVFEEMIRRDRSMVNGVARYAGAAAKTKGMREWLISKGFKVPEYTDNERLIDAAEYQDLPEMRRLIKAGAGVNYSGESGWTPLTKASALGQPLAVKLLLENKANPNSVKSPGWNYSALCLATTTEIADMLFAAGADINVKLYGRDVHIITYRVTFGPKEMVQWFIDHGVDPVKTKGGDGPTLLFDVEKPDIAELLIKLGVDVNAKDESGETALFRICTSGNNSSEAARVLIKYGADPNARDDYGFTPAMRAHDGATVDVLAEAGADLNAKDKHGQNVLVLTAESDISALKAVLRHGVTFDAKNEGPTMLVHAAWVNNVPVLKWLLEHGADPNTRGYWSTDYQGNPVTDLPLDNAAMLGHEGAIKVLLEHGANGEHPMILALHNNHPKVVKLLWDLGVHNISELCYAVSQGAPVADLQKLLDRGIPVDPPQDTVITPLTDAAGLGRMDVVEFLVKHGADVNKGGLTNAKYPGSAQTPLRKAASEGRDEIVDYLLKHGARPDPAALEAAAYNSIPYYTDQTHDHFERTVKLLIDAGALKDATPEQAGLILDGCLQTRSGAGANVTVLKMLLDAGLSPEVPMPYVGKEKATSVIGYFRDIYDKSKNSSKTYEAQYAVALKPLLDLMEKADASRTPKPSGT